MSVGNAVDEVVTAVVDVAVVGGCAVVSVASPLEQAATTTLKPSASKANRPTTRSCMGEDYDGIGIVGHTSQRLRSKLKRSIPKGRAR